MRRLAFLAALCGLVLACAEKKGEPVKAKSLAPAPLPALVEEAGSADGGSEDAREAVHRVVAAELYGHPPPAGALELSLRRGEVELEGARLPAEQAATAQRLIERTTARGGDGVVLRAEPDAYLAQLAWLFAALDDVDVGVWLAHPTAPLAYPLQLRDERAFQAWLEEPKPGKVRVIQRADGFELQTNIGKLPGVDRNGPSVPARGGQQDVATLRRGLVALKGRFAGAPDACLMPSFGTELSAIAQALSGMYRDKGEPIFEELCLVYPRPGASGADR